MNTENAYSNFPQVLFLGNGLNRSYCGGSWDDLLKSIWSKELDLTYDDAKEVPYPLKIVLGTQDHVSERLKEYKKPLCNTDSINEISQVLEPIWNIGFDHILTTNYSYELELVANMKEECKKKDTSKCSSNCSIKKYMHHTDSVSNSESKYLLHTYNCFKKGGREQKVWHIHGEARKSDSIIIGHYYYGKLLEKIQQELSKRENKQFRNQKAEKPPIMDSWLDAFIMGDVYMLGFGCAFSEMDIWWLLNRKKRENANHGKVFFYEPSSQEYRAKHELLRALDVDVLHLNFQNPKDSEYPMFYKEAMTDIQDRVNHSRRDVEVCPNL